MPYFPCHRVVFIHIPKTGGSSISRVFRSGILRSSILSGDYRNYFNSGLRKGRIEKLRRANPDRKAGLPRQTLMQHFTAHDVREALGSSMYEEARRFCVVRNPWDRLVSFYEYGRQRGGLMETEGLSFKEWFISRPITPQLLPYIRINASIDTEISCLRFERLDAECGEYLTGLGLRWKTDVHEKKTTRGDYRLYYTDEMAEALYYECREDIDYFGYQFS